MALITMLDLLISHPITSSLRQLGSRSSSSRSRAPLLGDWLGHTRVSLHQNFGRIFSDLIVASLGGDSDLHNLAHTQFHFSLQRGCCCAVSEPVVIPLALCAPPYLVVLEADVGDGDNHQCQYDAAEEAPAVEAAT